MISDMYLKVMCHFLGFFKTRPGDFQIFIKNQMEIHEKFSVLEIHEEV